MKNLLTKVALCVCCLLTMTVCAQKDGKKTVGSDDDDYVENRDSTWGIEFDFSELDPGTVKMKVLTAKLKRIKNYNDSMMNVVKMRNIKLRSDSLEQLYDLMAGDTSSSYNAYSFFAGQYHCYVSGLNKSLASLAWPRLNDMGYHVTNFLDFTWKRNRFINDIFVSLGNEQNVTRGDISVSYSYLSPLNYNIGYCVLDKKRVQFFPYLGLLYQSSELAFVNNSAQPFNLGGGLYDSLISATAVNKKGVEYRFKKRELALNYGLELDIHLVYSKRKTGFIVGLRAGGGLPLLSSGWRLDGTRYSQLNEVKVRDYYYDVVLRVYTRREDKQGTYYLRNTWWEN